MIITTPNSSACFWARSVASLRVTAQPPSSLAGIWPLIHRPRRHADRSPKSRVLLDRCDGSGRLEYHPDGILHLSSPFPIPPRCPLVPSLNHEVPWAWRGLGTLSTSQGNEKCLVSSEAAGTRTQDQRIKSPMLYRLSYSLGNNPTEARNGSNGGVASPEATPAKATGLDRETRPRDQTARPDRETRPRDQTARPDRETRPRD